MSNQEKTLVRANDAAVKLGISRTTLWRLCQEGILNPVKLTARTTGFLLSDLERFIDSKIKR